MSFTATARQFVFYGTAAGFALLVHLSILVILVQYLDVDETLASALGFICAVPVNFYLQRRFVFVSKVDLLRSFATYLAITFIGLGLNTIVFWLLTEWTELHYTLVQIVTTLAISVFNFVANRTYSFSMRSN